ncbi:LysR family transcriptional regulator [Alteromonas gilva]|uniref:LysR family transcriptional regulator n=1 Tax=Alteromonas gilva TaxID=2987522 RepID=A0ABT5L6C2_9ALTE|nr:LysR family transcriptional regulator [Alteromonas gilva]MDC8831921.1 LysR family transcriptional regulator [Alteromonas gilva]
MKLAGRAVTEYDIKLLQVFKSVVENGGFAAAESELGLTRSTISIHMNNLETRLRLTLCQRGRGGFVLTPDGRQVYQASLRMFEALSDFSHSVTQLSQQVSGGLVVLHSDILDQTRSRLLAEVVAFINAKAPALRITLDGDRIENIERALIKDKAHVGLFPDYRRMAGLRYQAAFDEQIFLCCSRDHPLFSMQESDINDDALQAYPAVVPGVEISQAGRAQVKKLNPGATAYQFDSRKALIASGKFIGYLPQSYMAQEIRSGSFKVLSAERYVYHFSQSVVHKEVPAEPKKVRLFIEALTQCAQDYPQITDAHLQRG